MSPFREFMFVINFSKVMYSNATSWKTCNFCSNPILYFSVNKNMNMDVVFINCKHSSEGRAKNLQSKHFQMTALSLNHLLHQKRKIWYWKRKISFFFFFVILHNFIIYLSIWISIIITFHPFEVYMSTTKKACNNNWSLKFQQKIYNYFLIRISAWCVSKHK